MLETKEMIGAVELGSDRDMRIELGENLQPAARSKVIGWFVDWVACWLVCLRVGWFVVFLV